LLSADGGFAERDSFCDAKKMVQSSLVSSLAYINEKGGATASVGSDKLLIGIIAY
jgi:hypothetical protein